MKVFLSWSGEPSRIVAEALHDWLPRLALGIEPWLSGRDLDSGTRWQGGLVSALQECNFGVICLTRESQSAPFPLFEGGALSKQVEVGRVVPLLIGFPITELIEPWRMFQARPANREGLTRLAESLTPRTPGPHLRPEQIPAQIEAHWTPMAEALKQAESAVPAAGQPRARAAAAAGTDEVLGYLKSISERIVRLESVIGAPSHKVIAADLPVVPTAGGKVIAARILARGPAASVHLTQRSNGLVRVAVDYVDGTRRHWTISRDETQALVHELATNGVSVSFVD